MKIFILFLFLLTIAFNTFAQCTPEEVGNMSAIYKKGYDSNYKPTKEAEKWMTDLFTAVIEPALKTTKGLKGTWSPQSNGNVNKDFLTPQRLINSNIAMYMNLLGCSSKTNTLYEKSESGLVLNFSLNSLKTIGEECRHQEYKLVKGFNKNIFIYDVIDGNQIYTLDARTASDTYSKYEYYRKDDYGKYFVISKPGIPLFISLTLNQVLEVEKKNGLSRISNLKDCLADPEFQSQYTYNQKELAQETKSIQMIDDYIANSSSAILNKPFRGSTFFTDFFWNARTFTNFIGHATDPANPEVLVILNPDYFNRTVSKYAPQFICVELRTQGNSPTTLKAFNDFEANLDMDKLQQMLVK